MSYYIDHKTNRFVENTISDVQLSTQIQHPRPALYQLPYSSLLEYGHFFWKSLEIYPKEKF